MNFKLGIKTLSLGLKMAFMREKDVYGGKCKCLRDYFQVKCDISLLFVTVDILIQEIS